MANNQASYGGGPGGFGGGFLPAHSNLLDENNPADLAYASQWFGGSTVKAKQFIVNDRAMGVANNTYATQAAQGVTGTDNAGFGGLSPVNQAYALAAQNGGDWTDYLAQTTAAQNDRIGAPNTLA